MKDKRDILYSIKEVNDNVVQPKSYTFPILILLLVVIFIVATAIYG